MKKDPGIYLLHIRDALDSIERYTYQGEAFFFADEKTQDAVIYNLAIIGEAVKQLPKAIRNQHASIPWKKIAGMRDVIIHDYDRTEIRTIWNVVHRDLPLLRKMIELLLEEHCSKSPRSCSP